MTTTKQLKDLVVGDSVLFRGQPSTITTVVHHADGETEFIVEGYDYVQAVVDHSDRRIYVAPEPSEDLDAEEDEDWARYSLPRP